MIFSIRFNQTPRFGRQGTEAVTNDERIQVSMVRTRADLAGMAGETLNFANDKAEWQTRFIRWSLIVSRSCSAIGKALENRTSCAQFATRSIAWFARECGFSDRGAVGLWHVTCILSASTSVICRISWNLQKGVLQC